MSEYGLTLIFFTLVTCIYLSYVLEWCQRVLFLVYGIIDEWR